MAADLAATARLVWDASPRLFSLILLLSLILALVPAATLWVGKLLIDAINMRDYPQVAASVLLLATIYGIVNLAVDILYQIVDPRIRLG